MRYIRIFLGCVAACAIAILGIWMSGADDRALRADIVYGFPSLHLTSQQHPFYAERTHWHDAYVSLTGAGGYNFRPVAASLRGRGNSTWVGGPQKRPLRIRFDRAQPMLGTDYSATDWILLANLFDLTLLRNHAAFYLSAQLDGLDWTPASHFVHLYINGEYMGVYELLDERDIGPGRMDLIRDPDPTVSELLFEMDRHASGYHRPENVADVDFIIVKERTYRIRFPSARRLNGHIVYLRDFIYNANEAVYSGDFEAIKAVFDLPSLIDFYLLNELFKTIDIAEFSVFMQIRGQGDTRRLHFGPVWDFDRSSGNNRHWNSPRGLFVAYRHAWFSRLIDIPEMFELIAARWQEISPDAVQHMIEHIEYMAYRYRDDFLRNFYRHNILDGEQTWTHRLPYVTREIDTWEGQVEHLAEWFRERVEWMDEFFS